MLGFVYREFEGVSRLNSVWGLRRYAGTAGSAGSRALRNTASCRHTRAARAGTCRASSCCRIRSLRLRCARPHSILAAPYTLSLQFDTSNDIDLPCAVFCPIVGSNTHAHVVVVVVVVGGGGGGGGGNGGDAATTLDKLGAPVVH